MNAIILVGRLAQNPEVRYTKNGKAVASFTVAADRPGTNGAADFIPVVAWEHLAELCGNNLGKGSKVLVHGRLQIRSYEASDGQKRRVAEVVAEIVAPNFSDSGQKPPISHPDAQPSAAESMGREMFPEDEIPF